MKKNSNFLDLYTVFGIVMIAVGVAALVSQSSFRPDGNGIDLDKLSDLSTDGYSKVDVRVSTDGNSGIVLIQAGCYQVTANTELQQVESITNGQEGIVSVRPNSHDLMRDALNSLDIKVLMVKIVDIRDNNYIGWLVLQQGTKIVNLDSRPSDAIAIAVRTGAPVYMNDGLLKSQGKNIC